jgi:uncharacterized membrane protein
MSETPGPLHLDALIQPNRSLSQRGMWVVLGIVALFNVLIAIFLLMIGAYPVPIFLGLDLIGVTIAFTTYRRRANRVERVRVDADRITVSYEPPHKTARPWSSPTAFTRIQFEGDDRGARRLFLRSSGRFIAIGQHLGDDERARLAARITLAISDALAERHAWPREDAHE